MLKDFKQKFQKLPASNKSMIYLMWVFNTWAIITAIFINIYIFNSHKSMLDLLFYNAINYILTAIWFTWIWFLMSYYHWNIKNMYYFAYIWFTLSFITIFLFQWYLWIYLFAMFYWMWKWIFRCAVHTQELVNIEGKTRDLYSSFISSWSTLIKIVIPFAVAFIFFIVQTYFLFDPYLVLFWTLPLLYI